MRLEVPEPLRLLARIPVFRVFVSTTFDPWLEQALIAERFGGLPRSIAIPYTPEEKPDLSDQQINSDEPVVFQLFGRISPEPRYAVTEEDLLESLYSLQQRPPENLCDVLRGHHLLCVGNAFSDWLARFFIRTARGERLITRANEVFFVDNELRRSSTLKSFFQGFCWGTNMLEENAPVEFVRLLYQKWCERHPETTRAAANSTPQPAEVVVPQRAGGSHSLFISYANEDAPAANRLHDCLKKVGLNVWLDKQGGLTEGDAYRAKIRQDIARCTLFLPVLSRNTERRKEGFFREEWYEAIQRLPRFKGSSRPFIMPIVIDDLPIYEATDIPEKFKQLHMTCAPGGELPEEVTTRYQQIVRGALQ